MGILIIVLLIIAFILIVSISNFDGDSFTAIVVCILIALGFLNCKTTSYDKPVKIPISKISILIDDEVAILRYGDVIETYDNVKEYKAIKDSSFKFMETRERNVFGTYNGSTYELIIK